MNPKRTGAADTAPSPPTETSNDNRHNRSNCQVLIEAGEATAVREQRLFTLPVDQIGTRNPPGAIAGHSVQPLPLEVGHSDHKCVQAWRDETHAVYKHFGSHGQFIGWEAIRIKLRKPEVAFGKSYPWREVYPGNEDFGTYALSVGAQYDLEYAIEKAKTLKPKAKTVAGRTGKPNLEQYRNVLEPRTN